MGRNPYPLCAEVCPTQRCFTCTLEPGHSCDHMALGWPSREPLAIWPVAGTSGNGFHASLVRGVDLSPPSAEA